MGNVSLPAIVSKLPNDVRNFLQRVRELLVDLDTRSTVTTGGTTTTIIVGGGGDSSEPDYTQPPAPTGLTASGSITTVFLQWDDVSATYDNLSHTEIWRSATNNLGTAVLNGTAQGHIYQDAVDPMSTYYYWVRMVSLANVDGPFNAVEGVAGVTSQDPASVVELLTAHGIYTDTPYYYQAIETTINGVVVPVGTYIRSAFMANGSITTAMIGNAQITDAKIDTMTADKLTAGTITGQEITVGVGGNIKSGQTSYNTGTGWWIGKGVDGYSRFSVGDPAGAGFDWSEETGVMNFRGIIDLQSGSTIGGISADYIGGWASSLDNTKIDGVNIHADSSILTGSTAPEEGGRYSVLSGGDITFYDYIDSGWVPYKSVTKTVTGTCVDGETVNIGYFREQPSVLISPFSLSCYNSVYKEQSQTFNLSHNNLRKIGNDWYFDTSAKLELAAKNITTPLTIAKVGTFDPYYATTFQLNTDAVNTPVSNSYDISVTLRIKRRFYLYFNGSRSCRSISVEVYLEYYINNAWHSMFAGSLASSYCYASDLYNTINLNVSSAYPITAIRAYANYTVNAYRFDINIGTTSFVEQGIYIDSLISRISESTISVNGKAAYIATG